MAAHKEEKTGNQGTEEKRQELPRSHGAWMDAQVSLQDGQSSSVTTFCLVFLFFFSLETKFGASHAR